MTELILYPESKIVFPAARVCIYCGATRYTEKSAKLAREHIIPHGLGGQLIFLQATCRKCEVMTREFENFCQKNTLSQFRYRFNLPTRKPKKRPKELPLDVEVNGRAGQVLIPVERFPVYMALPLLSIPEVMRPAPVIKSDAKAFHAYEFRDEYIFAMIREQFGVGKITVKSTHMNEGQYTRMLAKIAHSFAVSQLGVGSFKPLLYDAMKDPNFLIHHYVGGTPGTPVFEDYRHKLVLTKESFHGYSFWVVRITLFGDLRFPEYICVVGHDINERDWKLPFVDRSPWYIPKDELPKINRTVSPTQSILQIEGHQ